MTGRIRIARAPLSIRSVRYSLATTAQMRFRDARRRAVSVDDGDGEEVWFMRVMRPPSSSSSPSPSSHPNWVSDTQTRTHFGVVTATSKTGVDVVTMSPGSMRRARTTPYETARRRLWRSMRSSRTATAASAWRIAVAFAAISSGRRPVFNCLSCAAAAATSPARRSAAYWASS